MTVAARRTMDGDAFVTARGVIRTFAAPQGRTIEALGPIDLTVPRGQFVAVVGPSGCGKSTLLRIAAGLTKPSEGSLDLTPSGDAGRLLAMVFQDYGIFPWKSVRDNVRFGLDLKRVQRQQSAAVVDDWLGRLGLASFADAMPRTLSGGMRQRVAIARAFASDPELLLMDEPFAALDAQLRTILQDELLDLVQATRRTVLFVTHSLDEAIVLADRVIVISSRPGRIIADHDVPFERPRTAEIRGDHRFGELREELWSALRREVERAHQPEQQESAR